ncbi:MAG TPA: bifunctional phosphopantothenoylcysteine decarboxylase/phosphopantothenate--cysteine ligase CoaBC [Syntrophales bacterium]|nr:bifunctional phosphopantothenoylcysteine decarboxylase/phosphopantothenate--cysteine ligase CoaBC [Syntrophales bacterium]
MLKNKKILLGVTGGIAAYKAAELTREFVKRGASVKVIMTANASKFITPLTMQTLSGNPVYTEMFSLVESPEISHISLADWADVFVIAPATANIIGKAAAGIGDDLLSTTIMAARMPVLFCPAMNSNMYAGPIVGENIGRLRRSGYRILEPESGELACGVEGAGRLPSAGEILDEVERMLTPQDLAGEKILVTAGPTREPFDPVRFITNYSSGKMGYALAEAACKRGACVLLVSGPAALTCPRGVELVGVSSAVEMKEAVMRRLQDSTVIIKAAAVADYRPAQTSGAKIKKEAGPLRLALERNPDIIAEIGRKKGRRILVGFAMETENLIGNARIKLKEKNMDLIVANDLSRPGSGFQTDTNIVKILDRRGGIEELPIMEKSAVANHILDRVLALKAREPEKKQGRAKKNVRRP